MKHIELNYPSLAEAYSKALEMLDVSDLGHATRITIDIDENSPYMIRDLKFPIQRKGYSAKLD